MQSTVQKFPTEKVAGSAVHNDNRGLFIEGGGGGWYKRTLGVWSNSAQMQDEISGMCRGTVTMSPTVDLLD